jgi:hypothetical protein
MAARWAERMEESPSRRRAVSVSGCRTLPWGACQRGSGRRGRASPITRAGPTAARCRWRWTARTWRTRSAVSPSTYQMRISSQCLPWAVLAELPGGRGQYRTDDLFRVRENRGGRMTCDAGRAELLNWGVGRPPVSAVVRDPPVNVAPMWPPQVVPVRCGRDQHGPSAASRQARRSRRARPLPGSTRRRSRPPTPRCLSLATHTRR